MAFPALTAPLLFILHVWFRTLEQTLYRHYAATMYLMTSLTWSC